MKARRSLVKMRDSIGMEIGFAYIRRGNSRSLYFPNAFAVSSFLPLSLPASLALLFRKDEIKRGCRVAPARYNEISIAYFQTARPTRSALFPLRSPPFLSVSPSFAVPPYAPRRVSYLLSVSWSTFSPYPSRFTRGRTDDSHNRSPP